MFSGSSWCGSFSKVSDLSRLLAFCRCPVSLGHLPILCKIAGSFLLFRSQLPCLPFKERLSLIIHFPVIAFCLLHSTHLNLK